MQSLPFHRVLSFSLILAFVFAALLTAPAAADCPDGDGSSNTLTCDDYDPNNWTGGAGDDTMTQEDTSYIERAVSGGTGDDTIVINGEIDENSIFGDAVYGDGVIGGGGAAGGDDTIIINGDVEGDVLGDGMLNVVGSDGGDDVIIINGSVDNNVTGDGIRSLGDNSGGDDLIIINGYVDDDVLGDGTISIFGESTGGNDTIVINGEVEGDVVADAAYGDDGSFGGDDTVIVNSGATIWGALYGGDGTDRLKLTFIPQATLNGLDPDGDSIDWDSKHYEWYEFESLIGQILAALGEDGQQSVIFLSGSLLGLDEDTGIKVFSENGPVAFIPYADLGSMTTGDSLTFQQPNSGGWYVVATDLGVNPDNGGNHLYQISIYDAGGVLQGQFTVAN